jgi:peptidoglycan-N-acetylglucosamine deacetylase
MGKTGARAMVEGAGAQASPESVEKKLLASISVDVDSVSCYYRAYAIDAQDNNAAYSKGLLRLSDLLEENGIHATFFVVAGDVRTNRDNARVIQNLAKSGHEIANHTMTHPFRLTHLPYPVQLAEISEAEKVLSDLTGEPVIGFRSPGWDIDAAIHTILENRGYHYDSSVFPSFLLLPLKLLHRMKNTHGENMTGMGSGWFSIAPASPYFPDPRRPWRRGARNLLEIPIGVVPDVRLPFLGTVLFGSGWNLFRCSFGWMLKRQQPFTFGLHPIELLGITEDNLDTRLGRQPGMHLSLTKKFDLARRLLTTLKMHCCLVTMREMTAQLSKKKLPS